MYFDLTRSDDEDEPELLLVDSSIEEILVEKKKPSSSTRKSAEKRPREQRHPSPVKKKKEQKDEEIIYLDMDDDEEGKEKEGEEEVIFASVSPIPISKIKKRKVATTIVALAPPGEKRRALIEASGKGGALSNPSAPPLSTEWRWSCPECYREFSGNGIDTRHIEITRPGVLADCARKAQSSQLSSPAYYSPSSFASSSSSMSDAHHLCSLDATNWEVVLLLDSREVRTRTDRTYIYNMLVAKERVNCEVRALPLGDVTWVVRRKKDSPRPAKIPPQLVRGEGGGGKSFFGMAIASCGSGGGVLPSSSSSSTAKTTSTSSKPTAAKKSTKDSEKKELKEKEKKAKLLAASSAPRAEEEYLLDYIIERKSCNDLAASIIDGRYNEQKMRLSNSGMRVTYLIEGDPHQVSLGGNGGQRALSGSGIPPVKIGAKHILTAMTNTQVFAGFHVVQTTSIDASISHIAAMHRIIEANFLASLACERETSITDTVIDSGGGGGGGQGGRGGESPMSMRGRTIGSPSSMRVNTSGSSIALEGTRPLSSLFHRRAECPNDQCSLTGRSTVLQRVTTYATWAQAMKRPRHMTVMTLFGRALRQVSGCSAERAQAILERYPTPASLLAAYKALPYPVRDGPGLLKGLPVRGQKACIGPALSSAVYEAFQGRDRRVKRVSTKDEEDEDKEGGGEEGDELKEDEEV
jgi:ERCC4-type nuclease